MTKNERNPFKVFGRWQGENVQLSRIILFIQTKVFALQAVSFLLLFGIWRRLRRKDAEIF